MCVVLWPPSRWGRVCWVARCSVCRKERNQVSVRANDHRRKWGWNWPWQGCASGRDTSCHALLMLLQCVWSTAEATRSSRHQRHLTLPYSIFYWHVVIYSYGFLIYKSVNCKFSRFGACNRKACSQKHLQSSHRSHVAFFKRPSFGGVDEGSPDGPDGQAVAPVLPAPEVLWEETNRLLVTWWMHCFKCSNSTENPSKLEAMPHLLQNIVTSLPVHVWEVLELSSICQAPGF